MSMLDELLDAISEITGKDMGDFGGWGGLKEYCLEKYGDNIEVLMLVAFADKRMSEVCDGYIE